MFSASTTFSTVHGLEQGFTTVLINLAHWFSCMALGNSQRLPMFLQWEKGDMAATDHQSLPQEEKDPT